MPDFDLMVDFVCPIGPNCFESNRQYVGIDPDLPFSGPGLGCETDGGWLRHPFFAGDIRAKTLGQRWLAWSKTLPSRDAYGKLSNIGSNEVLLIPASWTGESHTLWQNGGLECVGDICGAWPEPDVAPPACTLGTLVAGQFVDKCWVWGNTVENQNHVLRLTSDRCNGLQVPISIGYENLYQRMRASDDYWADNLLIFFLGKRPQFCNPGPTYYNESASDREEWSTLYPSQYLMSLNPMQQETASETKAREIRNLAFAYLNANKGPLTIDQLEHNTLDARLGLYERFHEPAIRPVITVLPDCRLRDTGAPVTVSIVIKSVSVRVHMVLRQEWRYTSNTQFERYCLPSFRAHVDIQLGATATLPNPVTLTRSWLPDGDPNKSVALGVDNNERFPAVTPVGSDTIIYTKDGVDFYPPSRAEWWGEISDSSSPSWDEYGFSTQTWPSGTLSCFVRENLSDMMETDGIGGKVTHRSASDKSPVYKGKLTFTMLSTLCDD